MRRAVVMLAAVCGGLVPASGSAQSAAGRPAAVDVFLDCQTWGCDSQHLRNEITFVNWVRDRTAADVHLLVTAQGSGGGGSVYQLAFIGLRAFRGDSMTAEAPVQQTATQAERRDLLTNRIAQGLLRYAMQTQAADRITIEYAAPRDAGASQQTTAIDDPWNFWVFSLNANGSLRGETRGLTREFELSGSARRITALWKLEFSADGSYEEDRFELRDGTRTFVTKNWEAESQLARAVAPLWSAGLSLETGRSTFENQNLYVRGAALVERSFFPYEQFSRRQVTLQYSLGARHLDYMEKTIYEQLSEQRMDQRLELSLDFQQPWGSARTSVSGSHYLHDLDRYRLNVNAGMDVRLFRGFSVNVNGGYSRVHDQIYIPAGDLDNEEILLRRQALATNYRYDMRVGVRYTFGSVYNNIVNPRLGGQGGGPGRGRF